MDKEIVIETIDSLCGIAKDSGKSIDDYKKERLSKYETSPMLISVDKIPRRIGGMCPNNQV